MRRQQLFFQASLDVSGLLKLGEGLKNVDSVVWVDAMYKNRIEYNIICIYIYMYIIYIYIYVYIYWNITNNMGIDGIKYDI